MQHKDQAIELRKVRSRIDWMVQDRIAAFSPTISPAPKSVERKEIESLLEGVRYYADRGVRAFVFQRKYMGSYCDIYLQRELEATYFVSRNGYKIDYIDLEAATAACASLHKRFDWTTLGTVIIQAEMMPWDILGSKLIDRQYRSYLYAHQQRLDFYKTSDLLEKIRRVKSSAAYLSFIEDRRQFTRSELLNKYRHHELRQLGALAQFEMPALDSYQEGLTVFEQQLRHYGQKGPLYFKPFNVLKYIYQDGSEEIPDDNLSYRLVNDDPMMTLELQDAAPLETQLTPVYRWFYQLGQQMEEGIVIKPQKAFIAGLPPALKVRHNDYLSLIYGVDFKADLPRQIGKRKIARKLKCSIEDWQLNYQLVQIPLAAIGPENYYYKNLMLDRILQEHAESKLDPAL